MDRDVLVLRESRGVRGINVPVVYFDSYRVRVRPSASVDGSIRAPPRLGAGARRVSRLGSDQETAHLKEEKYSDRGRGSTVKLRETICSLGSPFGQKRGESGLRSSRRKGCTNLIHSLIALSLR